MLEWTADVLVASFVYHVKPGKQGELHASLTKLMERTRWHQGCLGCRMVASIDDPRCFTLIHEWVDRQALDDFLHSSEYRILMGMRFLMDEEPRFAVDEVVTRAHIPIKPRQG